MKVITVNVNTSMNVMAEHVTANESSFDVTVTFPGRGNKVVFKKEFSTNKLSLELVTSDYRHTSFYTDRDVEQCTSEQFQMVAVAMIAIGMTTMSVRSFIIALEENVVQTVVVERTVYVDRPVQRTVVVARPSVQRPVQRQTSDLEAAVQLGAVIGLGLGMVFGNRR